MFHIKQKLDDSIDLYKACLVAKGFHERPDIDYIETFSPIAKLTNSECLKPCLEIGLSVNYMSKMLFYFSFSRKILMA